MSGMMALLSLDGRPIGEGTARAQIGSVAHMGEWEPSLWMGDGIALGHVNFPTTHEAEREVLPAADATGRFWMTWDGRLDNRDDLAVKLGLSRRDSQTLTDAAFVLAALQAWGDEAVHRLVGEWALVTWDAHRRRLFCARDPIGARPMYYVQTPNVLAIGVDPRQFLAARICSTEPDWDFVRRRLAGASPGPGSTCYADIKELEGGQVLVAEEGNVSVYWPSTPFVQTIQRSRDLNSYLGEFEHAFDQAMTSCLRTNRKVGAQLSGGIDSSYVTAIAAQRIQLEAFTVFAPGTRWMDERDYASQVASHCDIRHHLIDVSDCHGLSSAWIPDETFDSPAIPGQGAAHVKLARVAAEHGIGVMLTGEGADEWMTGSASASLALVEGGVTAGLALAKRRVARGGWHALARDLYRGATPRGLRFSVRALAGTNGGKRTRGLVPWQPEWEPLATLDDCAAWQRRERLSRSQALYRASTAELVPWRQRHALAPSHVELRSPFNDLRVIDLVGRIPEFVKFHGGRPKGLLRLAEADHLPAAIPARMDCALYDELLGAPMVERELGRIERAVEALRAIPGVDRTVAGKLSCEYRTAFSSFERWKWSALTTGLWLVHVQAQESVATGSSQLQFYPGKEVMTREASL